MSQVWSAVADVWCLQSRELDSTIRQLVSTRQQLKHSPFPNRKQQLRDFEQRKKAPAKSDRADSTRQKQQLREVFGLFDLGGNGSVDAHELLTLAAEKRVGTELQWGEAKNQRLMGKVDSDGNGSLDVQEFVVYFMDKWHGGMKGLSCAEFDETIEQFTDVARRCKEKHK